MARIFCGKSFAQENVTQMRSAIFTQDFGTHTVLIGNTFYRSFDLIIKTRPATVRFELGF
jgi:hypothetical protein